MNKKLNSVVTCSNCVMDSSDPTIIFDDKGVCDYCNNYYDNILPNWHTDERGRSSIMKVVEKIKADGTRKEYDCIIGISGGLDSSYQDRYLIYISC